MKVILQVLLTFCFPESRAECILAGREDSGIQAITCSDDIHYNDIPSHPGIPRLQSISKFFLL
jgi:hypothetical protein